MAFRIVAIEDDGRLSRSSTPLSQQAADWVEAQSEPFILVEAQTSGMPSWDNIYVLPLALDEKKRGSFLVYAQSADNDEPFEALHRYTAWEDGGANKKVTEIWGHGPVAIGGCRIEVNGNDIEFQVRGIANETWDWTAIIFTRDF